MTDKIKEILEEFEEHFERCLNDYWHRLTPLEKERYFLHFYKDIFNLALEKALKSLPRERPEYIAKEFQEYRRGLNSCRSQVIEGIEELKIK